MKWHFLALVIGATLSASTPAVEAAKPQQLAPTNAQAQAALWATRFLTRFHYKRVPLDDAMSARMFNRYLETLDGGKMFFLQSDIDEFTAYKLELDDAVFEQDLAAPFKIYDRYLSRTRERAAAVDAMLAKGFDFSVKEEYAFDREDLPWAKTAAELDDIWRKRLKNDWLRLKLAGKDAKSIQETLSKRYHTLADRTADIDEEDVFQAFMNAYAVEIEPHTNYLAPRASENFNMQMRLSLEGIGAVLQREDEYTAIRTIVKGGPADMSGKVKVGDRVLAVGQGAQGAMVDVVGWRLDDVVDLIRGKKGTVVKLDILPGDAGPDGKPQRIEITRDKVKLEEQAAKKSVIDVGGRKIGVITLPTFYHDFEGERRGDADFVSSTADVARLIGELKKENIAGIVMDLRGNGGGSLTEATDLTGLFIDKGPVVQVKDAQGRISVEADRKQGTTWDGPLAIMIDRESASASEIFAAALQDYGRALIIGQTSFGKGTVQNLFDLDHVAQNESAQFGQLKLTIAQFFRVNGGSTQHRGVSPDIAYPDSWDAKDYGESSLDNALPWTSIQPAQYELSGDLKQLLPMLSARHEARIGKNIEYRWWQQDLADYHAERDKKTISLLESERRKERDEQEQKRADRKKARIAAGLDEDRSKSDDGLQADERPLAEQVKEEEAATSKEDKPDFLLVEAATVLNDAIDLLGKDQRLAEAVGDFAPPARSSVN